jgi:hypothetical protein
MSTFQSFFLGLVMVLILHFAIKHYLLYLPPKRHSSKTVKKDRNDKKVRFHEEHTVHELTDNDDNEDKQDTQSIDLKHELLKYAQQFSTSTESEDPFSELDNIDETSETDGLSKYFQVDQEQKYVFEETPTDIGDRKLSELPAEVDEFSKEAVFTEENADTCSLSRDQWKYANERSLNGGSILDGVKGFDSYLKNDNFAVFSQEKDTN